MRKFNCPYCSTSFEIPENVLQIKCKNCEKVIDINEKNDIDKLFETAEIAFKFKNYEEAYKFYTKIIELDIDNHLAWYWKALSAARTIKLINLDFSETISSLELAFKKAPAEKKQLLMKDAVNDLFKFVSDVFDVCFIQFKRLVSLESYEIFGSQSKNIISLFEKLYEYDPNNINILEKILYICEIYKSRYKCTLVNQYVFLLDAGRLEAEKKIEETQNKILKISPNYGKKIEDSKKQEISKTQVTKRPFSILALIFIFTFFILILIPFFINPRISALFYPIWGVSTIFTIVLFIFIFINKQPRKKWFIIFTVIAAIISIPSFIIAVNFDYGPDNELTIEETTFTVETTPKETESAIVTAGTNNQENISKFSFDQYINKSKIREYKIITEQNISLKALGNKLPSEFTSKELSKMPINFRMKYFITIPRDITEEELKSTLAQIIKEKSSGNLDIDEIYIAAWYEAASAGKAICLAYAEWCPEGRWEQMPPEIAQNNVRDTYLINFKFNVSIEQEKIKYGLTEQQRKQAFYELVQSQDQVSFNDSNYNEKMNEAVSTIAKIYGITEEQMWLIGLEGALNGWPVPELVE